MDPAQTDLRALLQQFGHDSFRPGQERIIRSLLGGRDVLAVLPTGAGKSLVYQLAAQMLPGATIVVSPLIALMKDQAESLAARGLGVSLINSTLTPREAAEELRKLRRDQARLLYVTPERFDDDEFVGQVRRLPVALLVVDEAHCISEWGHSFRPAYLHLPNAIERLGRPTLLALTATATPWIRDEISARLGMHRPDVVVRGVDRPNLLLEVRRVEAEDQDRRELQRLLAGEQDEYPPGLAAELRALMRGSGIIYTATTGAARDTAAWLREWGVAADYYHGRRSKADRARVQDAFMAGELRVIAATNAFGLGVDKPDVRFVIHRDAPASLEAYYQEAGRAGRDGEPARCVLIYRPADLGRAAFLSAGGRLTRAEVRQARAGLLARPAATMRELERATGLGRADLTRLVELLKRAGLAEERRGHIRMLADDFDPEALPLEQEDHRRAYERSRIDMMRGYAEATECRRRYLLNYFGEDSLGAACGRCDCDLPRGALRVAISADTPGAPPFALGERVVHAAWGAGVVQRVAAGSLTVLFDTVGYKMLAVDAVLERRLLERAG